MTGARSAWASNPIFSVRLPRALSACAALLALAGCAPRPRPPAPQPAQAVGNAHVQLTLTPAAPRALNLVGFAVHAAGKDGLPLSGAQVTADLTMPGMDMPPNHVALAPAAPGVYAGQGRFSMPDQWAVTVTVTMQGRRTVQAFPVRVR